MSITILRWTLGIALVSAIGATGLEADDAKKSDRKMSRHPIYGQKMKSLTGKTVNLSDYRGKVLLIVNTASECGATPQYAPLQKLHEAFEKKGLEVLGFPCNQFGAQEPGTEKEISAFCQQNYGVKFDMFSKIEVNGEKAAPLFAYLTSEKSGLKKTGPIGWNFEKILVGRNGKPVARFGTGAQPDSPEMLKAIKAELAKEAPRKAAKD